VVSADAAVFTPSAFGSYRDANRPAGPPIPEIGQDDCRQCAGKCNPKATGKTAAVSLPPACVIVESATACVYRIDRDEPDGVHFIREDRHGTD